MPGPKRPHQVGVLLCAIRLLAPLELLPRYGWGNRVRILAGVSHDSLGEFHEMPVSYEALGLALAG